MFLKRIMKYFILAAQVISTFLFFVISSQKSVGGESMTNTSQLFGSNNGKWLSNYTNLHNAIKKGKAHPKFVVTINSRVGLADNLTGFITQFMFAILNNRALFMATSGVPMHLEDIFDTPNIDLFLSSIDQKYYKCLLPPYPPPDERCPHEKSHLVIWKNLTTYPLHLVNANYSFIESKNLSEIIPDMENINVIFFAGNRGRVLRILENHYYKTYFSSLGIRPETIFSDIFHYLFRFKKNVICSSVACSSIKKSLHTFKNNNTLIIGIQIRYSDIIFSNETSVNISHVSHFFTCAEEYAESVSINQSSVMFLITNSLELRKQAKKKYGNRLLTDVATPAKHSGN